VGHLERYAQYPETLPDRIRMASAFPYPDEKALENALEAPKSLERLES